MIEAKGLRIGNWVFIRGNKNKVYSLKDGVVNSVFEHYVNPIPLTEDWLEKFGFGKSDETEMGHNAHDEFGFYYDYDESGILFLDSGAQYHRMEHITCVHQLQNLYFALTGEELELIK